MSAPELSADVGRYPDASITPWHYYGRCVWPMGEDCEDGVMVQGNDRRAWAALNAYARTEDPGERPDRGEVQAKWVTFRTSCGCTAEEHDAHAAEKLAALREYTAARRACAEPGEAAGRLSRRSRDCAEITGNEDCWSLPPCEDERMAWFSTDHDPDSGDMPESAAPVLWWPS